MVKLKEDDPIKPDGSVDLPAWLVRLSEHYAPEEMAVLQKACELARMHGESKITETGETCFRQGLIMADILAELRMDEDALAAAILFHTVKDAGLPLETVQTHLNPAVEKLIQGTNELHALSIFHSRVGEDNHDLGQMDKLRRMLLAMVEDVRVVLIKLAEHVCVLRAARDFNEKDQRRIAKQSRDIYAPLANRLGVGHMKWEMEDLSFRYLEPVTYKQIAKLLAEKRVDRQNYIHAVVKQLKTALTEEGIQASVKGRVKHIFSIWRKMKRKNVDYHEIYDVRAVRIMVKEIRECYAALGIVHKLWRHIPREFDDYIALPKENGYRSLHTAVIGAEGKTLEVQIRTYDMHQESELGVASHWRYKEGVKHDPNYENKIAWLRQLLDWQSEVASGEALPAGLARDVLEERIYVFTPKGKVIDLPEGATPLDFAYQVHTEIGHRCRGAKINGRMVPLTYKLSTAEQVEILTTPHGTPSRDWLNPNLGYLASAHARAKVHQWFKRQNWQQNRDEGETLLHRELQRLGITAIDQKAIALKMNYKTVDDWLAGIGAGDIRVQQIITLAQPHDKASEILSTLPMTAPKTKRSLKKDEITIQGVGNLLTHMAGCCKPVPGDRIIGYITQGAGVSIHRQDCANVLAAEQSREERLIAVDWGTNLQKNYPVTIFIRAYDRQGLLRDITSLVSNEKANVVAMNLDSNKKDNTVHMRLTIEISSVTMLARMLDRINQLPNVIEATRQHHEQ